MKKNFLSGAGSLAAAVILAKILGAVYRIPLANMLGAEGMGLYQFVYPIFALLLTLSGGAIPTAVSVSVSELTSQGKEEEAKRFFSVALLVSLVIGSVSSVLLAALAYPVSTLQDTDAFWGYLAVSPAVLIVTLVSAFRGWFTGHNNLLPPSLSQITEGVVKLGVGLSLTYFLLPYGIPVAVVGALCGVTASELVTLIIMVAFYLKDNHGFVRVRIREEKERLRSLGQILAPLVLCGMILPLSQFIDSILLVNLLRVGGFSDSVADYGIWSGMVTPLINLPVMVCISLGVAITPQMVESRQNRDVEMILDKSTTAVKMTFFLGIPFVILYFLIPNAVLSALFSGMRAEQISTGAKLLRIDAFGVLGLAVFQIYSAMLQGLKRIRIPAKILAFSMTVKLLLTVLLTPRLGVMGVAASSVSAQMLAGIWIGVYYIRFTRPDKNLLKNVSLITACGGIMGSVLFITSQMQFTLPVLIAIGVIAAAVYILSVLLLDVFTPEEWKAMPLSSFFIKLSKKIHKNRSTV